MTWAQRPLLTAVLSLLTAASAVTSGAASAFEEKSFEVEFRRILEVFASGDPSQAIRSLVDLEVGVADGGHSAARAIDSIRRTEQGIVRSLAAVDPEVLVPIVLLYQETAYAFANLNQASLAGHSLAMATELVDDYVEMVDSEPGRSAAADLLTSLAISFTITARDTDLLDRALRLDPSHEGALLSLGKRYERAGEYKKAVPFFERLIENQSRHPEAELRLAILLVRLDNRSKAREIFQALRKTEAPIWIRSLAYQELARILMEDNEIPLARSLLKEAAKEFPSDGSLMIPLAYLTERDRLARRENLVDRLQWCAEHCSESTSRSMYAERFGDSEKALRAKLRSSLSSRLSILNQALKASASKSDL